jgi:hypothetical protein
MNNEEPTYVMGDIVIIDDLIISSSTIILT